MCSLFRYVEQNSRLDSNGVSRLRVHTIRENPSTRRIGYEDRLRLWFSIGGNRLLGAEHFRFAPLLHVAPSPKILVRKRCEIPVAKAHALPAYIAAVTRQPGQASARQTETE